MFHCSHSLLQNLPFWKDRKCTVTPGNIYCCLFSEMKQQPPPLDQTKDVCFVWVIFEIQNFELCYFFIFFAIYLSYHISSFSCIITFIAVTSHPFLHHIILCCVDILLFVEQQMGKSPQLWWNFCTCNDDWNTSNIPVNNTLFWIWICHLIALKWGRTWWKGALEPHKEHKLAQQAF